MSGSSVYEAAQHLSESIPMPRGSVNTLAFVDAQGPFIRVLVDPACWLQFGNLPREFEGYRVVVEKRPAAVAYGR